MSFQAPPPPPPLLGFHGDENAHSTSPFQNLKPSILVIILILCITLLVSVSLCLLLRLLNRRCLRRLSPTSSSSTTIASNRHSANRVSPETPEQSILDSLPLFSYSAIKRRGSSTSAADCAVCLSRFESNDQLRLLPLCCHAFHAQCIDTWLVSNQTCPLCRSSIHASESEVLKTLSSNEAATGADSFRLEIGSISRRQDSASGEPRSSYSIGSFEYIVEEDSEISMRNTLHHQRSVSDKDIGGRAPVEEQIALAEEVAAGRSWLKDYVDRLSASVSSRAMSFRSSGRFFAGSSRRSESVGGGEYDMEAARVGEEISELFRWFSGV